MRNEMYQISFLAMLLLLVHGNITACSCSSYEYAFCRNASEQHNIVRAVVTGKPEYHLMEVHIIENMSGEITDDTIVVLGHDGINCGESLELFAIEDTLILALSLLDKGNQVYWFLYGACGLHFLRYADGLVIGNILGAPTNQPIQEFRDHMTECLELGVPVREAPELNNEPEVFPQPASNVLYVSSPQDPVISMELIDLQGRHIACPDIQIVSGQHRIQIGHLHTGFYLLRVRTAVGIVTRGILKD